MFQKIIDIKQNAKDRFWDMKHFKFCVFIAAILFAGCQTNGKPIANTPVEALELLSEKEGFAKVIEVYGIEEIAEERVLVAFRGMLDQEEDVYVANIETQGSGWAVTDAVNLGLPSLERLDERSITEKFEAGYTIENINLAKDSKIIKLKNSDVHIKIDLY